MEMIEYAEQFLIHYVEAKSSCTTFDELRCKSYFRYGLKADLIPCTSTSIRLQIKRAYLQCKRWLDVPYGLVPLDPLHYGYNDDLNGTLFSVLTEPALRPPNLPAPCKYKTCSKDKSCVCRSNSFQCSKFCKCDATICKNSFNI